MTSMHFAEQDFVIGGEASTVVIATDSLANLSLDSTDYSLPMYLPLYPEKNPKTVDVSF